MKAKHYATIDNVSYFISEDGTHWKFSHESESWCKTINAPFEIEIKKDENLNIPFFMGCAVGTAIGLLK